MPVQRLSNHEILAEFRIPPQNARNGCILFGQRYANSIGMPGRPASRQWALLHSAASTLPTAVKRKKLIGRSSGFSYLRGQRRWQAGAEYACCSGS